jgi:hypothetical protein
VFKKNLAFELPDRVLPISKDLPKDILLQFEDEVAEIRKLLAPKSRKKFEAHAKLRVLAALDNSLKGEAGQPDSAQLNKLGKDILAGMSAQNLFLGVAAIELTAHGAGPSVDLRIVKKGGSEVKFTSDGTGALSIKRVNELEYYKFQPAEAAKMVGLTLPKFQAVVQAMNIKSDDDYYKKFPKRGAISLQGYSPAAIKIIKDRLPEMDMEDIWEQHKPRGKRV